MKNILPVDKNLVSLYKSDLRKKRYKNRTSQSKLLYRCYDKRMKEIIDMLTSHNRNYYSPSMNKSILSKLLEPHKPSLRNTLKMEYNHVLCYLECRYKYLEHKYDPFNLSQLRTSIEQCRSLVSKTVENITSQPYFALASKIIQSMNSSQSRLIR